ncbi:MAG TPA: hypothetical protein VFV75_13820 [Candidatus Polarisedimenticolaceae bacterium]|nr:hypothetical protein [Candidatus Polarisedimenticolaceae bacterium]
MTAQLFLSLFLVLLSAGWLAGRVFRRARVAASPCSRCALKSVAHCRPCRR